MGGKSRGGDGAVGTEGAGSPHLPSSGCWDSCGRCCWERVEAFLSVGQHWAAGQTAGLLVNHPLSPHEEPVPPTATTGEAHTL